MVHEKSCFIFRFNTKVKQTHYKFVTSTLDSFGSNWFPFFSFLLLTKDQIILSAEASAAKKSNLGKRHQFPRKVEYLFFLS